MDDLAAIIEALEHQWMRAWLKGDRSQMKGLASRDFIFLLGSEKPTILDRPNWLDAATSHYRCKGFRFDETYVRRHGRAAFFACHMELDASLGATELTGQFWVTGLWARGRVRRKWRLVERTISRADTDPELSKAVRQMQLWH